MSLGPVMVDLSEAELLPEERELLKHPRVGGVILFSRNYQSPEQIRALVAEIHGLREPRLLVAVDHEGGRVQRFRAGFTGLPAAARYGEAFDADPGRGLQLARWGGWLMAAELRAVGVDLSFAPVLDLHRGISSVIDDRAFHRRPHAVLSLAGAFTQGMREGGMVAVGKHFPGHGSVEADSHVALPVDPRPYVDIRQEDLVPFAGLAHRALAGIMPAHVVYSAVDREPAGFSRRWLQGVLRQELGFTGAVFSDDLSMAGAAVAGGYPERARAALEAGCDVVLVCNDRAGAAAVLASLVDYENPVAQARRARLHGRPAPDWATLRASAQWHQARAAMEGLERAPELALGDDGTV